MLILVAVTITMAINGGLFGYAGNAVKDTEAEKQKETRLSNVPSNLTTDGLIDYYTKGEPVLATFIWTGDSGSDGPYEVTFEEGMTWGDWLGSDYYTNRGISNVFSTFLAPDGIHHIVSASGWMLSSSSEGVPTFNEGGTIGAILDEHPIIAGAEYCYYSE